MPSFVQGDVRNALSFRTLFHMVGWLRNPETPTLARILAGLALAYVVMPVDLVPDLVPIFGWADDATLFTVLMTAAYLLVPASVKNPRDAIARRTVS